MKSLLFLLLFVFSIPLGAQSPDVSSDQLNEGWNTLPTSGLCSSGTAFNFYVNDVDQSEDLLIFFNGGGACWFGEACDLTSQPNIHSPFSDMRQNNPRNMKGIFDKTQPQNPFKNFSAVYIPYCTGDVHIGGGEQTYEYTNQEEQLVSVSVNHNGFENSSLVLEWLYDNYPDVERVVVAGSSAGAIGASFYSGMIAENYLDSKVYLIGDAAGGYGSPLLPKTHSAWQTDSILPDWDEYEGKDNSNLTFEDYYSASANHSSNLTISQFNTAEDQTQKMFTQVIGDPIGSFSLPQRILNNYLAIESSVEEFFTYTAGGDVHTVLQDDIFYEYAVEGVYYHEWLSNLIEGKKPADISCVREVAGCSASPVTEK